MRALLNPFDGAEQPPISLSAGVPRSLVTAAGVALLAFWAVAFTVLFGKLAWRYPLACTGIVALIASVFVMGFWGPVNTVLIVGILLLLWSALHNRSYERLLANRLRSEGRRFTNYGPRWRKTTLFSGLASQHRGRVYFPKLTRVVSTRWRDELHIKLLVGQSPAHFEARTEELASSFAARSVRVRVPKPGRLVLEVVHIEPLAVPFPPPPIHEECHV